MAFSGAFLVQRQFLSGASKDISPGQDYLEESENYKQSQIPGPSAMAPGHALQLKVETNKSC